ncbi:hypothetical protein [Actinomadura sp. HBU206391]|uniref:hypothetical protein n=1 Tax=Actinomadura sp. HBU206391 TaxID=2731692 RepID=UPI00164F6702|nr:hypothetical protein [Actinomadura sp. HBU206391]MBC6458444.1 hypothetical protein [Actinomadura sp. HBU206391]
MDAQEALEKLEAAARRFRRTKKAHNDAREAAAKAVLEALAAGARPTDVAAAAPFTDTYVRRIVREDKERREREEAEN